MELSNILSGTCVYDFVRGPLVWISFIIFILGTIFQVFRLLSLTRVEETVKLKSGPGSFLPKRSEKEKTDWGLRARLSIFGVNPFLIVVTTLFHVLLVIMPIFVLGHNILLDNAFGISLFAFPEKTADVLTQIVIICAMIFLYRRLFVDRVKAITDWKDYLFLLLAAAPFITGYFAFHQTFSEHYRLIITLHILSGELMLMAIPFTKFIHMFYLVIIRLTVKSEYSLGQGDRVW
ncbi:MAG: respiratory nitrate reductase subunit gamma [Proteobacteria bacterium]|nr:respiratory nitrate reductase subunit gamma [Pseudomonadota bacterium]